MGVFTATARNLFVCLSFLFLTFLAVPVHPVLAQSQKPVAQSQKPAVSYDEKKRQANDIAVTVVVSGISCTCARFTEDIRNIVNDLGPDGVRVLPVLGVGVRPAGDPLGQDRAFEVRVDGRESRHRSTV